MPSLTLNFRPESIGAGTPVNIYLPDAIVDDMPVLYLLHGMHGDHNSWVNGSSIGRYARARGLAVIMPSVGNSFYTNQKHGCRYFDYVAHELPDSHGERQRLKLTGFKLQRIAARRHLSDEEVAVGGGLYALVDRQQRDRCRFCTEDP